MKEAKKTLIYQDDSAIRKFEHKVEAISNAYQRVLDEGRKLEFEFTTAEVMDLVKHPAATIVKNKVLDTITETQTVGRFKVKREKILETLELPDTSLLQAAANVLKQLLPAPQFLQTFEINSGRVQPIKERINATIETFRIYSSNPEHIKAANLYRSFIERYKEFDDYIARLGMQRLANQGSRYFRRDDITGELQLNPEFYKGMIELIN